MRDDGWDVGGVDENEKGTNRSGALGNALVNRMPKGRDMVKDLRLRSRRAR